MKKTLLTISIMAGLMMTACVKESANEQMGLPEGAMMLTTEGFQGHNTKTSVSGTSVQWVGDGTEKVYLNGNEYTVGIAGGNAYVNASSADKTGETYGYTGLEGTPTWTSGNKTLSVTVPAEYTSSYSGGRQVIALPMVAYKDATADKIEFKHVTAAVKVRVKNTTNYILELDKVVVSSSSLQLSGSRNVTLSTTTVAEQAAGDPAADDKSVTVNFAENTYVNPFNDNDANIVEVQVPILPVDASSDLTIQVYAHVAGTPAKANTYLYSHAASNVALDRNIMITAGVNVGGSNTTVNLKGLFSVSGTKQVFFSKGNLQWTSTGTHAVAGDGTAAGTWRFAEHQYDYVGDASSYGNVYVNAVKSSNTLIASDYTGWIDLFGWGTSGYDSKNPYMTSTTNSSYGNGDANDIAGTNYDWGVYNAISNGGNVAGKWRTMTGGNESEEWHYVLVTRSNTTTNLPAGSNNGTANFVRATVNGVTGEILFPDNYVQPDGVTVTGSSPTYNGAYSSFAAFTVDVDNWEKMENAGAIFIPVTGYRTSTSYTGAYLNYWTSTHYTASGKTYRAYYANQNGVKSYTYSERSQGYAVRLVMNAN